MKVLKILLKILKTIIIVFILFFLAVTIVQKSFNNERSILGFRIFTIVTPSMEPRYKVGDVIITKEKDYEDIKVGEDLVYLGETSDLKGKVITHEIQNITTENNKYIYYTKGLKNLSMDPAVYQDQVYGTVVYRLIIVSIISKIIRHPIGFFLFVFIPLIGLFISEMIDINKELKKRKEEKSKI